MEEHNLSLLKLEQQHAAALAGESALQRAEGTRCRC